MSIEKVSISENQAIGKAHSKLILVGEHAVVHGMPAVSLPFKLIGVECVVESSKGDIFIDSALYRGFIRDAPKIFSGIIQTIKNATKALGLPFCDMFIRISSTVPPGKGLGSSASVAVAIVKSLFTFAEKPYTSEQLLELANISETYAHGAPSGIDTLTVLSSSPIWYVKGKPAEYIVPGGDFNFVVADTGKMADTKTSVATVKQMLKQSPEKIYRKIERIGEITHQAREALEKKGKQLLGFLMNEAQRELDAIGVSDQHLNRFIQFTMEEGALGAKLTGGGNGGCIIALAEDEFHAKQLCEKLKQFGAVAVWPLTLKSET